MNEDLRDSVEFRTLKTLCEEGSQTRGEIEYCLPEVLRRWVADSLNSLCRGKLVVLVGSGLYWPTIRGQRVCREIYGAAKRRHAQ